MAVTSLRVCDVCGTTEHVNILTGVYGKKPFEVDLCTTCYEHCSEDFAKKIRRPTRSTIKPQHRFAKTSISKTNL